MKTITKKVITVAMSLALVAGTLISPKTMMTVKADYIEETYTPANGDIDTDLVKINNTAKTIWVKHDDERSARNLYTFSGFDGYKVTVISAYNLVITLKNGVYEVEFDCTHKIDDEDYSRLSIGENTTIDELANNIIVDESYGVIETNNTGIFENYGRVLVNNGTITKNYGIIEANAYYGGIDQNFDTVLSNSGTVGTNKDSGIVEENTSDGEIVSNSGIIATNIGEVETNANRILCNEGTVKTNNGTVKENKSGAVVETNNGKVYSNAGEVLSGSGLVSIAPEPESDDTPKRETKKETKKAKKDDDKPTPTENQAQQEAIYNSLESQIQSIASLSIDSNVGEPSSRMVTIDGGEKIYSLPQETMAMIAANPNITVTFTYIYNGVKYMTVIPAGAVIDPTIEWFGPAYLMCHFPTAWVQPGNELVQVVAPVK